MDINLGNLRLPAEDFIERATGLIAKRGRGKSGLVKVVEEELLKLGLPFVVFDPTGIHWGIKSSFDGKKPSGHEVLVVGGYHGDLPLDRHAGRIVARAFANTSASLIVDFKGTSHAIYRQFVSEFSDELLDINKIPRLLILEEAPRLIPQKMRPDQTQSFDAVARLVLEGRNSGLGCIAVSQRAATVSKDVLTQMDNMVVMGITGPQDRKAIKEWVEENADAEKLDDFLSGLAGLQPREAWFWSPDMDIFKPFRVKDFKTFHPDRTHLRRMGLLESAAVVTDTKVLVSELGEEIRMLAETAKENDPTELKRRISKLEKQLRENRAETVVENAPPVVYEIPAFSEGDLKELQTFNEILENMTLQLEGVSGIPQRLLEHADTMRRNSDDLVVALAQGISLSKRVSKPNKSEPVKRPGRSHHTIHSPNGNENVTLSTGEAAVLAVALQFKGASRGELRTVTGYAKSTVDTYVKLLREKAAVDTSTPGMVYPTPLGEALLPEYEPLPTGEALLDYWRGILPEGERVILDVLNELYPEWVPRSDLVLKLTPYSKSTVDTYIKFMVAKRIVETGKGIVRAHPDLFKE